jgi:hypothetical protein
VVSALNFSLRWDDKLKILFQGGWKTGRDPDGIKELVTRYCRSLASHIVDNNHAVVLTSTRDFDEIVAQAVSYHCDNSKKNCKDHLILPGKPRYYVLDGSKLST